MLTWKLFPAATAQYFKISINGIDCRPGSFPGRVIIIKLILHLCIPCTHFHSTLVETAVKIQPEYVMPWNNLAEAYKKKKQYKYAIRTFQEALLFDPNNKLTLGGMAVLLETPQQKYGSKEKLSIAKVETAVKIQAEYVMPWNNLAKAYEKKKQYKYAIRTFQKALLFDPNKKLTL
nr:tetratricopeptide repeat domain-containing protein PYG7, chloroplastic [Tanacetum cinerariifolium]